MERLPIDGIRRKHEPVLAKVEAYRLPDVERERGKDVGAREIQERRTQVLPVEEEAHLEEVQVQQRAHHVARSPAPAVGFGRLVGPAAGSVPIIRPAVHVVAYSDTIHGLAAELAVGPADLHQTVGQ